MKKFPNIKIVNRDGSYAYAKAISQAHPNAKQISDYFHLVKNLSEYLKNYLLKKLPKILEVNEKIFSKSNINIRKKRNMYSSDLEFAKVLKELYHSGKKINEIANIFNLEYRSVKKYIEMEEKKENLKSSPKKILKETKQEQKQKLVNKVKELYSFGKNYAYIGRLLALDYRTVKKYVESPTTLIYKTPERTSSITPYKNEIIQLLNKGVSKKEIYNILREKGYKKAVRTFYHSISRIIDEEFSLEGNSTQEISITIKIKATKVAKLLYFPLEKISDLNESIYEQIIDKYPWITNILNIMSEFKRIVKEKNIKDYFLWIENTKKLKISELNGFIKTLEKDQNSIINAIFYRYTNGLAEGFVNKLKTIKRSMYGKASFQSLRRKLLYNERD